MYTMLQSPNKWLNQISDCVRHFSNRCDIFKVVKAVHGKQLDSHPNWSDTQLSILVLEFYKQPPCSLPLLECACTHTSTRPCTGATHTHTRATHTHTHANARTLSTVLCFWELVRQNNSWYVWPTGWIVFQYTLILTGKILEITG